MTSDRVFGTMKGYSSRPRTSQRVGAADTGGKVFPNTFLPDMDQYILVDITGGGNGGKEGVNPHDYMPTKHSAYVRTTTYSAANNEKENNDDNDDLKDNKDKDNTVKVKYLHSTCTSKSRRTHVLNCGGSVWGLDWAPTGDDNADQFLAVGGYRGTVDEHHFVGRSESEYSTTRTLDTVPRAAQPTQDERKEERKLAKHSGGSSATPGYIQLWCCPSGKGEKPRLDVAILHPWGGIYDLKWAPDGYFSSTSDEGASGGKGNISNKSNEESKSSKGTSEGGRLGLLAVCCGDGYVRVLSVPTPESLRSHFRVDEGGKTPLFVKVEKALFEAKIPGTTATTVQWRGHAAVVTGHSDGSIAHWDLFSSSSDIASTSGTCPHLSSSNSGSEGTYDNKNCAVCSRTSLPTSEGSCEAIHGGAVSSIDFVDRDAPKYYLSTVGTAHTPRDPRFFAEDEVDVSQLGAEERDLVSNLVQGKVELRQEMISSGYDSYVKHHRLGHNPNTTSSVNVAHSRSFYTAMSYVPAANAIVFADGDYTVNAVSLAQLMGNTSAPNSDNVPPTIVLGAHRSTVWDMKGSRQFPFVVTAGADGFVSSFLAVAHMRRPPSALGQTIYRLRTFRVLDEAKGGDVVVAEYVEDFPAEGHLGQTPASIEAYDTSVSVHRVALSPNTADLLASGGALGLVRVEMFTR